MQLITYDIQLIEPLLATALDGDPNSSVSYGMIPGGVLRGALAGKYGIEQLNSATRRLFFDGKTRFLNAYLLDYDEEFEEWHATYPLPHSLRSLKEGSGKVVDFVYQRAEKTERVEGAFGRFEATLLHTHPVERRITIHTQRHREYGRARTEQGAVYQYNALEAGQRFRAHILCEPEDETTLRDLLDGETHLGGSRSAGYGRVKLLCDETKQSASAWTNSHFQRGTGNLVITLRSDLLLRDRWGQYTTNPARLAEQLGLTLHEAFPAVRPIGGFNRKWGLPLPQATAFQMGSVFVFEPITDEAQWKTLKAAVVSGVGERCIEGFGQIAVNWQQHGELSLPEVDPIEPEPLDLADGTTSLELAKQMLERMLRERLDHAILRYANTHAKAQKGLSKSQIYRLRLQVQQSLHAFLQGQKSAEIVRAEIKKYKRDVESRNRVHKQYRRVRVDKQPLLEWIDGRVEVTAAQTMRDDLQVVDPKIGMTQATWSSELILEYNLRLVDAVLAGIAKKSGGSR